MLHLTAETRILLAIEPIDFRKQIDGIEAICRNHFRVSPNDGTLYVFINRAKTMVKILFYDENGYCLTMKRLSRGKYRTWPKASTGLTAAQAHELRDILRNSLACKS